MSFLKRLFKRTKAILIIEDNVIHLETTASLLEAEGFNIIKAFAGSEGLLKAQQKPDLILLDIDLPDIDGWQVLQSLKSSEKTKAIPVAMLTAQDKMGDVSRAFERGAKGYLTKPLQVEPLLKKVKELLG